MKGVESETGTLNTVAKMAIEPRFTLALSADDRYATPLVVTLHSVLSRLSKPMKVVVADLGLSHKTKKWIESLTADFGCGEPRYVGADSLRSASRKSFRHYSSAAYARLELPRLLEGESDFIVYLDCDALARRDLWEAPWSDDHAVSAVPEYGVCAGDLGRLRATGAPADCPYFNSGVMVIKIDQWLQAGIESKRFHSSRENS